MALMAMKSGTHKGEEGILLYEGQKYAVGLTWLMADDDIDTKLARDRAQKIEADLYCLRTTVSSQQGFGFLKIGHRSGLPSAASLASDVLVGEWHGVFAADNGWWYIAVHADSIAPDGDLLFFSEEEAYQHYMEQAQGYKWPRSYVPVGWNVPDASSEVELSKLLSDPSRAATLRPASLNALFGGPKQKMLAMMIGVLFLVFLGVAAVAPTLFSSDRPDLDDLVRTRILAPANIFAPPPLPAEDALNQIDLSALQAATPSTVVQVCANAIANIIIPLPGWAMDSISCDANNQRAPNVSASWNITSGSLEMVKQYIGRFNEDVSVHFNGVNTITARSNAGNLSSVIKPLQLVSREQIIETLYDRFGRMGQLEVDDVRPRPPPPKKGVEGLVEQEPPPPPPPYLTLDLLTETPPNIIGTYFDVSGLKMQNVSWNNRTRSWSYTAEIQYESKALREYYAYQQRNNQKR